MIQRETARRSTPVSASSGSRDARRARAYVEACRALGLNPAARPLTVRRRDGRDAYFATARAADELAARRSVQRTIVRGPGVLSDGRTLLAFAECEARAADGRVGRGTAVVALNTPDTALMIAETQARTVATLRALGLADLAEPVRETAPPGFEPVPLREVPTEVQPTRDVRVSVVPMKTHETAATVAGAMKDVPIATVAMQTVFTPRAEKQGVDARPVFTTVQEPARTAATRPALGEIMAHYLAALARLSRRDDAAALWIEHRGAIATLPAEDRRAAWALLCDKAARLGAGPDARAWLKREVESRRAV